MLIVDKTPPSISVEYPQNESYISSTIVTISWNIDDNMEAYAKIRIDDGEWIDVGRAMSYQLTLQEGQHTIEVMAVDISGNINMTRIVIWIDTTPPQLTLISPSEGEILSSSQVTIEWNASDSYGVAYYLVRIDSDQWINTTACNLTATLEDGGHTIIVKAYDYAGNYVERSIVITVNSQTTNSKAVPSAATRQTNECSSQASCTSDMLGQQYDINSLIRYCITNVYFRFKCYTKIVDRF